MRSLSQSVVTEGKVAGRFIEGDRSPVFEDLDRFYEKDEERECAAAVDF